MHPEGKLKHERSGATEACSKHRAEWLRNRTYCPGEVTVVHRTAQGILDEQGCDDREDGEQDHSCLDLFVLHLQAADLRDIAAPERHHRANDDKQAEKIG